MLHNEFEKLTGLQVTEEEFNAINAMYMNAGDIDKKDFVEDWKKHKDSVILNELNDTCNYRQQVIFKYEAYIKEHKKVIDEQEDLLATAKSNHLKSVTALKMEIAEFLIDKAENWESKEFAHKAVELIGMKEFIGIKLQKGYTLYQKDKDFIIEQMGVKKIVESMNEEREAEFDEGI